MNKILTIEGRNPVLEALRAGQNITDVYFKKGLNFDEKVTEILELAKTNKIRYKFVSKRFLDNMSETEIHQGIIATKLEAPALKFQELIEKVESNNKTPFFVYIREAQNEYNIGSIIRSSEASGVNGVILPPKLRVTPQMVRSAMGASEHLDVVNENLFTAIKKSKKNGFRVVGIELTGDKYYYEEDLTGAVLLIIGGEDKSLSKQVTDKCDTVVKIPLLGKVNSLNMSIAASIVMFEKVKQEATK